MAPRRRKHAGFTVIEVLVALTRGRAFSGEGHRPLLDHLRLEQHDGESLRGDERRVVTLLSPGGEQRRVDVNDAGRVLIFQ